MFARPRSGFGRRAIDKCASPLSARGHHLAENSCDLGPRSALASRDLRGDAPDDEILICRLTTATATPTTTGGGGGAHPIHFNIPPCHGVDAGGQPAAAGRAEKSGSGLSPTSRGRPLVRRMSDRLPSGGRPRKPPPPSLLVADARICLAHISRIRPSSRGADFSNRLNDCARFCFSPTKWTARRRRNTFAAECERSYRCGGGPRDNKDGRHFFETKFD